MAPISKRKIFFLALKVRESFCRPGPLRVRPDRRVLRLRCMVFTVSLAAWVLTCLPAEAAETIEVLSPAPPHFAGQPLVFHVKLQGFVGPKKATVFYRPVGVSVFRKLPLTEETEIDFRGLLPARKSVPPGLEYFISIEDSRGRLHTLPELDPRKTPFRIDIELDRKPPRIESAFPSGREVVDTGRPSLSFTFADEGAGIDPASVRLFLDGVDVTGLAAMEDNRLTFIPEVDLDPGKHRLVVDLADIAGNRMPQREIDFTVARRPGKGAFAGLDRASAKVSWDAEADYGLWRKKDSAFPDWRVQSSATVRSTAKKDRLRSSLDASVWYVDEEKSTTRENWNLNNFLASFAYDDRHGLDLGDVTVKGTDLTGRSLARRGGRLSLDFNGTEAQAFMVRSNAVTGFNHILGGGDAGQQIWGGSLSREMMADGKLVLGAGYMTGKNYVPDDYNASTQQPGTEGDVFSLTFSSRLAGKMLQLEGEYAGSRFDNDITDSRGKDADHAFRSRVFGRLDRTDWEIGYRYYGPDFASIATPTGTKDREEIKLGGGVRFDRSSLRAAFLRGRDNVGKNPLLPVIHNTTGTLNYNLTVPDWPAVFVSGSETRQESSDEPVGLSPIANMTTTLTFGASRAAARWSLSSFYTFARFDDQSEATDSDSDTHTVTVAGGIRPTDFSSVNPSVTYTHIGLEPTGTATRTWQAALSGVVGFWKNRLNLNATASWLDNQTSDGALHTTTWSGIFQLNWSLEKYLLEKGRQTLSLRGQYNLTDDRIAGSDGEDFIVYAVLSFGLPWKAQ
jgi:hypothetical protein